MLELDRMVESKIRSEISPNNGAELRLQASPLWPCHPSLPFLISPFPIVAERDASLITCR